MDTNHAAHLELPTVAEIDRRLLACQNEIRELKKLRRAARAILRVEEASRQKRPCAGWNPTDVPSRVST
jgi:hypothetical protein